MYQVHNKPWDSSKVNHLKVVNKGNQIIIFFLVVNRQIYLYNNKVREGYSR